MKSLSNGGESPNWSFLVSKQSIQHLNWVIFNGIVWQRGAMGVFKQPMFPCLFISLYKKIARPHW